MPLIVLSPYSGNPVKVRDQDVGRAIRDEEGRVFYAVQRSDGKGYYASMTRNGSAKDEERYRELEAKTSRQADVARETVLTVHDATGRPRGGARRLVVLVVLLAILAAAAYGAFVLFGDALRQGGVLPDGNVPVPALPGAPQVPPPATPEPSARVQGAAFKLPLDSARPPIEGTVGAALADREGASSADPAAEAVTEPPLVTTASGLGYRILQPGRGKTAGAGDYVLIHYATLAPDGAVVDSTRDKNGQGDPIAFVLWAGQVIRGWDIGIAGMRVGERRRLIVPPQLVQSAEFRVPSPESASDSGPATPDSASASHGLRFDIELVDVLPGVLQRTTREGTVGGGTIQPGQTAEIEFVAYLDTAAEPFDSTGLRGKPLRFRLGAREVIQGLDLGIVGMKEGERRTLVIPPYLAYGQRGIVGLIPPDSALRYEVELKRIVR